MPADTAMGALPPRPCSVSFPMEEGRDVTIEASLPPSPTTTPEGVQLCIIAKGFDRHTPLLLHWGLGVNRADEWTSPLDDAVLPPSTTRHPNAAQSLFEWSDDAKGLIVRFPMIPTEKAKGITFVLHRPPSDWLKPHKGKGGGNFVIDFGELISRQQQFLELQSIASVCVTSGGEVVVDSSTQSQRPDAASSSSKDISAVSPSSSTDVEDDDGGRKIAYQQNWEIESPLNVGLEVMVLQYSTKVEWWVLAQSPVSLILHWGLINDDTPDDEKWEAPSPLPCSDPFITTPFDAKACRTAMLPLSLTPTSSPSSSSTDKKIAITKHPLPQNASSYVQGCRIVLSCEQAREGFFFVLKSQNEDLFLKNGHTDFSIRYAIPEQWRTIKQERLKCLEESRKKAQGEKEQRRQDYMQRRDSREKQSDTIYFASYKVSEGVGDVDCMARLSADEKSVEVKVTAFLSVPCVMHWGVTEKRRKPQWKAPPEAMWPNQTMLAVKDKACQSPLVGGSGCGFEETSFECRVPCTVKRPEPSSYKKSRDHNDDDDDDDDDEDEGVSTEAESPGIESIDVEWEGLVFVLKEIGGQERWLKSEQGQDFLVGLSLRGGKGGNKDEEDCWGSHGWAVERIVEGEVEAGGWTLMHRYHLCCDLINQWQSSQRGGQQSRRDTHQEVALKPLTRLKSWVTILGEENRQQLTITQQQSSTTLFAPAQPTDEDDFEFWSVILVWQRFSFIRVLDWQRNYNTKPRELADATNRFLRTLAGCWKTYPTCRSLIRLIMSTCGRGGNQGQKIRDEILHIMHRHHIKEVSGHFYEQWHQKLHNNTTPDDVGICRALIAFLKSGGNLAKYWEVLAEHGLSKDRLASYERAITTEPYLHGDTNALIGEFENYLKILQSVHDSTDIWVAWENAEGRISGGKEKDRLLNILRDVASSSTGGGVRSMMQIMSDATLGSSPPPPCSSDQQNSLNAFHHRFMRAVEGREILLCLLNDKTTSEDAIIDLLLLDFALEQSQIVFIQNTYGEKRLVELSDELGGLILAISGHAPEDKEWRAVCADWRSLSGSCARLSWGGCPRESALLLKGMGDRVGRDVGDVVDLWQSSLGRKAFAMGEMVGAEKSVLEVFVDELLRGSAFFAVSLLLKRLELPIRDIAQLPPWQLISVVESVEGIVESVPRLTSIQDKIFSTPTILFSGAVSGEEEIPEGVVAILVRDPSESPDILSHVSVRARNAGVLLAVCFDRAEGEKMETAMMGKWVKLGASKKEGKGIHIEEAEQPSKGPIERRQDDGGNDEKLRNEEVGKEMDLTTASRDWVIARSEFESSLVGGKSLNLKHLSEASKEVEAALKFSIATPLAVALPYGCMQKCLNHKANAQNLLPKIRQCLSKLHQKPPLASDGCAPKRGRVSNAKASRLFAEIQRSLLELSCPPELLEDLKTKMAKCEGECGDPAGRGRLSRLLDSSSSSSPAAWTAIKEVWASIFALRPWVSLNKAKRSFHDLNMAVLIQDLAPAEYAFVLHTQNPFSDERDELYGEIVAGLGETLVGNYSGRALSFKAKKGKQPEVMCYFSKSIALKPSESLIFRSDSNGEDLDGFAGAGLFESITAVPPIPMHLRYHRLRIIQDRDYRISLLGKIAEVGRVIESVMGTPQDVEGVVVDGDKIVIVQTRPQV